MADNVELNAGSGGATIRTDDDGTAQWQYVKLAYGADNTQNIVTSTATNSLPVALSDTDNAVLDAIQTAVELLDNAVSGSGYNISQLGGASVPIGGGVESTALRVTIANDSTGVLSIDDNGGSLTVDGTVATTNAGTFAVQEDGAALTALQLIDDTVYVDDADWTALSSKHGLIGGVYQSSPGSITDGDTGPVRLTVNGAVHVSDAGGSLTIDNSGITTIAGAVSGSEMQVDVVAALPAGTNAIGKLAANSGVDIGDVDILSVVPGTGATNLGKAEDAAHSSGDTGVMALGVQITADAALAGTDGDYAPFQLDENGFLKVNIKAGAGSGGTASTDDAAFTAGAGSGTPAMGFFSTDTVDSGDVGVLAMDASRRLLVSIEADNAGIGGGTQYAVDTALGATPTGTLSIAIRDDALSTLTPIEGDAIGLRVNARGALWAELDLTNDVTIADGGNSITVDNGGTFVVQEDGAALTALQLIDDAVHTDDAVFTLGTDKGMMIMGFAGAQSVNSNDAAALACNTSGVLHVNINSQTSDVTIADGGNSITVDNSTLAVVGGGTEATAMRVTLASDSTGVLSIDDNGGSITVDGTVAVSSLPASTNTIEVVGDVAHDSAAAGNPVAIAARATNSIEGLTQVAAADATYITSDLNGCVVTRPHTTLEEIVSERVSDTSGTSTAFTNFGAGGAGVHNYVTSITVWNSSATDGYVDIRDGAAGSILYTVPAPTVGGSVHQFPIPLKQTTANTALAYDVSGALSTVYISAIGFQAQG